MWCIHRMEHYSVVRKDGILAFATTRIDHAQQNKSHSREQEPYDFTHMWDIKQKATNEQTKQRKPQIQTTV